jgi:hypothetical protein
VQVRWRAALAAAALIFLSGAIAQAAETIHWQSNFAAAKAAAKKGHKLIMTDFYAEW